MERHHLRQGSGVVNVASSGVMTTVKGTLNVDEAVTLDTTLDVTGNVATAGRLDVTGATNLNAQRLQLVLLPVHSL